jgi:hypothetical protein
VAVLVVGSVLAYLAMPAFRLGVDTRTAGAVKEVRRNSGWGTYAADRPARTAASSEVPGHPASMATDLVSTDYWAADTTRDPRPEVTVTFRQPTDVDYLLVTSGRGPDFDRLTRPKKVRLSYSDGTSEELSLRDDPRATGYPVHGYSVSWIRLQVLSVYPAGGSGEVAIAELEFWRLS